jgi:hypothetical protein
LKTVSNFKILIWNIMIKDKEIGEIRRHKGNFKIIFKKVRKFIIISNLKLDKAFIRIITLIFRSTEAKIYKNTLQSNIHLNKASIKVSSKQ